MRGRSVDVAADRRAQMPCRTCASSCSGSVSPVHEGVQGALLSDGQSVVNHFRLVCILSKPIVSLKNQIAPIHTLNLRKLF